MKISFSFSNAAAYIISFFSFIGFYAMLAVILFLGFYGYTRYFTIPVRLLVTGLIIFLLYKNNFRASRDIYVYWFFTWFFILYFLSVLIKTINGTALLNDPYYELLLYSIIYAIVPFFYFSQNFSSEKYYRIFLNAVIASGVVLAVTSILLYGKILIAGYGRIDMAQYHVFFRVISPLALSYSSALFIGLSLSKLIFETLSFKKALFILISMVLGLVPFFLGASRGSVFALVIPLISVSMIRLSRRVNYKVFIIGAASIFIMGYFAHYFGSAILFRFIRLFEDMQSGGSSMLRLDIWVLGLEQFLNSPLFGSSIQMEKYLHPHNIIIEVLMSTGIIGFIPFLALILYSVYKTILITIYKPAYIWTVIFFWQGFIQHMFSGALSSAIFFWAGLGLITGINISESKGENT